MRIFILLAIALSLLVTVFAVQNYEVTPVRFLLWKLEGSLALVLMLTLILGIIIGVLFTLPGSIRRRLQVAELKRSVKQLESSRPAMSPAAKPEPDASTTEDSAAAAEPFSQV